jgi:hypothetical protein
LDACTERQFRSRDEFARRINHVPPRNLTKVNNATIKIYYTTPGPTIKAPSVLTAVSGGQHDLALFGFALRGHRRFRPKHAGIWFFCANRPGETRRSPHVHPPFASHLASTSKNFSQLTVLAFTGTRLSCAIRYPRLLRRCICCVDTRQVRCRRGKNRTSLEETSRLQRFGGAESDQGTSPKTLCSRSLASRRISACSP